MAGESPWSVSAESREVAKHESLPWRTGEVPRKVNSRRGPFGGIAVPAA
jgi:hypothetical protein